MHEKLMAISPLDGRYYEKLSKLRPIFSEYGLIHARVIVEARWLEHLCQSGIPELKAFSNSKEFNKLVENFSLKDAERVKTIESEINHDVKAVEYFIKEKLTDDFINAKEFIHFGCTSEDINNLAYALMLKDAREICLLPTLTTLLATLKNFAHDYAEIPMLARTHGQPATPTTFGKEIANVYMRLQNQVKQLQASSILGKMNGATGNYNAHLAAYPDLNWHSISKKFVESLGLTWNSYTTQIEPHDFLAEFFMVLQRINVILIDFARDVWGYISLNYLQQKSVNKEVGSSTMPHKINPIDFENAEGNLGIANALFEHMATKLPISRWQRDLSDSTVLRNIGVAIGHSLIAYEALLKGLQKVSPNRDIILADLNTHWEILAEPIQMIMRKHGIENPYEKLKAFTRGKKIDKTILHEFINDLDLPENVKNNLLNLTPETYIGAAAELAKKI